MNRSRSIVVACLLCTSFTISAFAAGDTAKEIYQSNCQGCHGVDGRGTNVCKKLGAKDFRDPEVARMSKASLAAVLRDGKNKMPSYRERLTEAEIRDLAKYIKAFK